MLRRSFRSRSWQSCGPYCCIAVRAQQGRGDPKTKRGAPDYRRPASFHANRDYSSLPNGNADSANAEGSDGSGATAGSMGGGSGSKPSGTSMSISTS